MKFVKNNPLVEIKKNLAEIIENSKTIDKLEELRDNLSKTLNNRIEALMREKGVVRKVKFPKIKFSWRYLLSIPFIYGMIIPSLFLHLCSEIYQQVSFRLYGIPRVQAKEYFIYDRQLLSLLSPIQKFNCMYCSYVNNLFRFVTEIGARTERYWCPIKYYKKIDSAHSQYDKFISGEETKEEFLEKWEELQDFSDMGKGKEH